MKLFIATDIHGSAYWAERVLQKFTSSDAEMLVLLGDIYNHGPRNPFPQDYAPMRVAEMLNKIAPKILAIQGNCDSEVDQMISDFPFVTHNVLPFFGRKLFFTHGHLFNKSNLPHLSRGDVLFYGHFHKNEIVECGGVICVNVGSCALPKDGIASYCVVDETGISICDFSDKPICQRPF